MGPLTSFLLSQLSEETLGPLQSKLAEKILTPAEVSRLSEDLVAEWQTNPELKARSLALVGKGPKDQISHRDLEVMVRLLHATHSKDASVEYHGKTFPGYNHPVPSDKKEKKMMVLAKKGDEVKLVHFGQKGYQHNYSPEAKQNYLTRSAGIRNKSGELTKDDPFSPNYWARKVLWPKGETGHGHNGPVNTEVRVHSEKKAGLFGKAKAQVMGHWHLPVYEGDPDDPKAKIVDWYQIPVHAGEKVHAPTTFHPQHGAVPVPHAKYVPVGHNEKKASLAVFLEKRAAELSDAARENIPASEFAVSKRLAKKSGDEVRAGEEGKYPIPDRAHARNALARVAQHGTPAEVAAVKAKVKKAFPDIDVDGEKKASLFDAIAARKENEKWAAAAKLAENENFSHGAELAGLGILAVPAAASVIGKKFKMPGLHRFGESDAVKHSTELAGLGTLAAPSVSHFLKKRKDTQGV